MGVKGFAYRRVKNDVRDAADLADLLRMGRLPEAWIAPPATRALREQVRHRAKLVALRSGLKAQVHAVLAKQGVRVRFGKEKSKAKVIDGPFAETKELIAGFWIWQVKSRDEAVEWLKRAPFAEGDEVEIRPVFETADFVEAGIPADSEVLVKEEQLRKQTAQKKG